MSIVVRLRWILRVLRDVLFMGAVNRSPGLSLAILLLLVLGLTLVAAQAAAPFIYTLF